MKITNLRWIAFIAIFAVMLMASCTDDEPTPEPIVEQPEEITFTDPLLLAQVKLALGLGADEDVNEENILELEELNIDAEDDLTGELSGIASLEGLEFAENLTYLRFGGTAVTDLSPIADLEKIEYLRFNDTDITDISPISNYTTLTYFNANTVTGLTDISPLAGNTGIKEIILRDVPFGNDGMATIANFTNMYRINMRGSGVTDLTVLGELMADGALLDTTPGAADAGGADIDLRGLSITNWLPILPYVSEITTIDGMPSNDPVSVPDSRLALQIKLALGVSEEVELTTLYMLSLTELNLDGEDDLSANGDIREISDLTGLEHAENITCLRFGATAVTDISPIAGLTKVEYLRFNDTGITDISALSGYTTLTYFNANSVSGITDISPLAGNTGIKEIILREVPFGNAGMATIRNFTNMYRINMRSTGVTDITVLGELMEAGALLDSTEGAEEAGGADLDLRGLSIEDWSPIEPFLDQISNIEGYSN
ncbi:hypothetical protein [Peijinzhouia sedimentorum]